MIEKRIQALLEDYRGKIAASKSDNEGIRHFLDLVRDVAAERAGADFLIFECEAEQCVGEEDPADLEERLLTSIAETRHRFAAFIADSLDHVKDSPVERGHFERFADAAYAASFNRLLFGSRGGTA